MRDCQAALWLHQAVTTRYTQTDKDGRQGCAQTKAPPVSWKGKRGYWLEVPVLEKPRAVRGKGSPPIAPITPELLRTAFSCDNWPPQEHVPPSIPALDTALLLARALGSRGINPACPSVGRGDRAMGMLEVTLSAAISITWVAAVVICASRLSIDDV
jgi:hypothetical protein